MPESDPSCVWRVNVNNVTSINYGPSLRFLNVINSCEVHNKMIQLRYRYCNRVLFETSTV